MQSSRDRTRETKRRSDEERIHGTDDSHLEGPREAEDELEGKYPVLVRVAVIIDGDGEDCSDKGIIITVCAQRG